MRITSSPAEGLLIVPLVTVPVMLAASAAGASASKAVARRRQRRVMGVQAVIFKDIAFHQEFGAAVPGIGMWTGKDSDVSMEGERVAFSVTADARRLWTAVDRSPPIRWRLHF